jgi:acetoin utilization deacetylase AcuC-like enzyme
MKIIFHPRYRESYDMTPAGKKGRLDPTVNLLKGQTDYEWVEPEPASLEMIQAAHSTKYINSLRQNTSLKAQKRFELARLAAGGAIQTAQIAQNGIPAFGLIRPPGHHASRDSAWGFCYLNNVAISLLYLRKNSSIKSAYILDFDLHLGDGNIDILQSYKDYEIYNPDALSEEEYLQHVGNGLSSAKECDIIVASAGFDQGIRDWGKLLTENAFKQIGEMMREFAEDYCEGRRYALLEGGYNAGEMAKCIKAFLEGFE